MKVTKRSDITGKFNTMDLPVDEFLLEEFRLGYLGHVQDAFPHLNDGQREFLLTGITPEEWDEFIGEEEPEEWEDFESWIEDEESNYTGYEGDLPAPRYDADGFQF